MRTIIIRLFLLPGLVFPALASAVQQGGAVQNGGVALGNVSNQSSLPID